MPSIFTIDTAISVYRVESAVSVISLALGQNTAKASSPPDHQRPCTEVITAQAALTLVTSGQRKRPTISSPFMSHLKTGKKSNVSHLIGKTKGIYR